MTPLYDGPWVCSIYFSMMLRRILWVLPALFLVMCVTEVVTAAPVKKSAHALPKSFAVFTTSYNTHGDLVRGGVCGTVFFVSPTQAITAFHVLKPTSFKPLAGFERVRVWLVHENYRPIEVHPEFLSFREEADLTVGNIDARQAVDKKFIYATGRIPADHATVETEGFVANTTGPVLMRDGLDIVVTSVPKLSRMYLKGELMIRANINLKAADIDLKSAPEYELSYKPVVGISGGPVLAQGRVIAMNSFADPASFKHTWALQLISAPSIALRP